MRVSLLLTALVALAISNCAENGLKVPVRLGPRAKLRGRGLYPKELVEVGVVRQPSLVAAQIPEYEVLEVPV